MIDSSQVEEYAKYLRGCKACYEDFSEKIKALELENKELKITNSELTRQRRELNERIFKLPYKLQEILAPMLFWSDDFILDIAGEE